MCALCRSHEFRLSYGHLHELRAILPSEVPFLACSPTVTPHIRKECVEEPDMIDCKFVSHTPDRSNIICRMKRQSSIKEDLSSVFNALKTHHINAPPTIVYTRSLNSCANLFATFQGVMGKQQYYLNGAAEK